MKGMKAGTSTVYKEIVFSGEKCPTNLATRGVPERCAQISVEPDARNKGETVVFKDGAEIERSKQPAIIDAVDSVKHYALGGAAGDQAIATFYQHRSNKCD